MPLSPEQYISVLESAETFNIKLFFECKACNKLFCTTVAFLVHKNESCHELCGNSGKRRNRDGQKRVDYTKESFKKLVHDIGIDLVSFNKKKPSSDVKKEEKVAESNVEEGPKENKKSSKSRKRRNKIFKQSQSAKQDELTDVKIKTDLPDPSIINSHKNSNTAMKEAEHKPKIEIKKSKIPPSLDKARTKKTLDECSRFERIESLMSELSTDDSDENDPPDVFINKLINLTEEDLSVECKNLLKYMSEDYVDSYFAEEEKEKNFSRDNEKTKKKDVIGDRKNSDPKTGNTITTITPDNMTDGKTCNKNLNKGTKKGGRKRKN